jgi:hypothetical protein
MGCGVIEDVVAVAGDGSEAVREKGEAAAVVEKAEAAALDENEEGPVEI